MAGALRMGAPRFEMRGIRKAFGATLALDGVDLALDPGEVCALVGENGAGKSTLMGILSGALQADAGAMSLDGAPYRPASPLEARRSGVGMIYQELSLAPHLSVMENIVLGMEPTTMGVVRRSEARRTAREALAQLRHTEIPIEAEVATLSPAEQQVVEIARALAVGCRVLVLDEPTSSLGRDDVARLFDLIAKLKAQGQSVVYISHFIEEVREVADRFVALRDGRNSGGGPTATSTPDEIVEMMIGRTVDQLFIRSKRRQGEAILDLEGFDPGAATLTLHRGEVLGIGGLMGSGRTRLLRALFGLEPVRAGRVRVGSWSGACPPSRRWRQGVGLLSEDRKAEGLALGLSVADNVSLSRLEGLGPGPFVWPSRQEAAARSLIHRLGIRCVSARQPVGELSGGNQQKVALARLFHHDVDVLLLDEPTRGVDVASKAQIYAWIDSLVSGEGATVPKAVLMVSSYLPELLGLSDRVAVMCRGRLGPARPVDETDERRLMLEATGMGDVA
jgi:ribose transport system ATP-binding protein